MNRSLLQFLNEDTMICETGLCEGELQFRGQTRTSAAVGVGTSSFTKL